MDLEVKQEIEKMLNFTPTTEPEEEVTEDEKTEVEEGERTEQEAESDTGAEQEQTEGGEKEEEVLEEKPAVDDLSYYKEQNRQLVETISRMSSLKQDAETVKPPEPKAEIDVYNQKSFTTLKDVLNLSDEEGNILKSFLEDFKESVIQKAVEETLISTPKVVNNFMTRQKALEETRAKFYRENKELEPFTSYVKHLANEIHQRNPEWPMQKVLDETAKISYKTLNLKKELAKQTANKKPAFSSAGKTTRGNEQKKSKMQSEIDELINL